MMNRPLAAGPTGGNLSATCVNCFTTGIAKASTTGFQTNDTLVENIADATKQLLTDPDGFLASALAMNVVVSLENLGGHFEFGIDFAGEGSISVPIFHPITPLGGEVKLSISRVSAQANMMQIQGNEVGIIFTIDLVFTVEAALGFSTGFDINFPKGASFSFNPISGDLLSMSVDGIEVAGIPFTFSSGGGTFTVALRVGLKAGLGVNFLGTGFELETGVYVDIPTYNATLTFDPAAECQLDFEENFFGVVAAFAQAGISVNYIDWQAGPSTAVTFFTGALPGGCIASKTSLPGLPGITSISSGTATAIPLTSTMEHTNTTVLVTTHRTITVSPATTRTSNATAGGIRVTSPAVVVMLPTPITGSFIPGSSISVTAGGTSKQAIAPPGSLTPGQQAPTSVLQVTAIANVTTAPYYGTGFPGFIGAQKSSTVSNATTPIDNGAQETTLASSADLPANTGVAGVIVSEGGFASAIMSPTIAAPNMSVPVTFEGSAVTRSRSGALLMLVMTALLLIILL